MLTVESLIFQTFRTGLKNKTRIMSIGTDAPTFPVTFVTEFLDRQGQI